MNITIILMALVIVGMAIFLLKSSVRLIIAVTIIVVLFRIGWVYSAEDIFVRFKIGEFIQSKYYDDVYDVYDDYSKKRQENTIVDTDKINEKINEGKERIVNKSKNLIQNIPSEEEIREKIDKYVNGE